MGRSWGSWGGLGRFGATPEGVPRTAGRSQRGRGPLVRDPTRKLIAEAISRHVMIDEFDKMVLIVEYRFERYDMC